MAEEEGGGSATIDASSNGSTDHGGSGNTNNGNDVEPQKEQDLQKKMAIQKRFWDMVANDDSEGSIEGSEGHDDEGDLSSRNTSPSKNSSPSKVPTSESSRKLARKILHELEDWEDEHDQDLDEEKGKNLPFVFNIGSSNNKAVRRNQAAAATMNDSFNMHDTTENLGSFVNDGGDNHDENHDDEGAGLISDRTEAKLFNSIERYGKIVTISLVCILILVFSIDAIIGAINEEKILEIEKEQQEQTTTPSPSPTSVVVDPDVPSLPTLAPVTTTTTTVTPTGFPSSAPSPPTNNGITTESPSSNPTVQGIETSAPTVTPIDDFGAITTSAPTTTFADNNEGPGSTTTTTSAPTSGGTGTGTGGGASDNIRDIIIEKLTPYFPPGQIPPVTSTQQNALDWLIVDYVESSAVIYLPNSTDEENSYRLLERFVLAVLYYESSGDTLWNIDSTSSWMSSESVCNWKDITCNDSLNTSMEKIELIQIGIHGTIPSELSTLSKLLTLSLKANSLTGQIPTEFGNFGSNGDGNGNLQHLSLGTNSLTGSIPTELFDMTALTFLQLSYNHLTGGIPTDLAKLSELSYLNLVHNNFSGTVPFELNLLLESIPFCQLGQGNPNLDGIPENCQV